MVQLVARIARLGLWLALGACLGGCPDQRRPTAADGPGLSARPAEPRAPEAVEPDMGTTIVAGIELRPLSVRSLAALSTEHKALAYHLVQACEAGHRIAFAQHHRSNLEIKDLLETLLVDPGIPLPTRGKIERYMERFWLNLGHHDLRTGAKFTPAFSASELRAAALGSMTRGLALGPRTEAELDRLLARLAPALFSPEVEPVLVARQPGKDRVIASAVDFYRGLGEAEAASFRHRFARNSRLVKRGARIVEEVWRAGGEGEPPGLYAEEIQQVVHHLQRARPLAGGDQRLALGYLIRHLRSGDPEAFARYLQSWQASAPPVELVMGFLSTHRDPLGLKGVYSCVVAAGCAGAGNEERACELLHAAGDPGPDGQLRAVIHPTSARPGKRLRLTNVSPREGAVQIPPVCVAIQDRSGEIIDIRIHRPTSWVRYNLARARAWRVQTGRPVRASSQSSTVTEPAAAPPRKAVSRRGPGRAAPAGKAAPLKAAVPPKVAPGLAQPKAAVPKVAPRVVPSPKAVPPKATAPAQQ